MNKKIRTSAVETLFEAIIQLKSVDECCLLYTSDAADD